MFQVLLVEPRFLLLQLELHLHHRVRQHLLKPAGPSAPLPSDVFYQNMREFDEPAAGTGERAPQGGPALSRGAFTDPLPLFNVNIKAPRAAAGARVRRITH